MTREAITIYLPGLNGLRALAAISVLLSHVFQDIFGDWGLPQIQLPFFSDGVTLFFVISGFLITYLLMREIDKTHNVDIPKFYIRRILRIWPLYYLYVVAICVLLVYCFGGVSSGIYYYLFFAANIPFISTSAISLLVHYWSIGVEEQFYLFWPWLVRFAKNRLLHMALIVFFVWLGCKYGSWLIFSNKSIIYKFFLVTRFHCMMIGAIGAILYHKNNPIFIAIMSNFWLRTVAWVIFLTSGLFMNNIPNVICTELVAIISLIMIMSQIMQKRYVIDLENNVFDFLGKISYGIYVIHPLVIYLCSKWYSDSGIAVDVPYRIQYVYIYIGIMILTIFTAWLSYTFFEKPFLRLKSHFTIIKSANSMSNAVK